MPDGGGRPSARWRCWLHLGPSRTDLLRRLAGAERHIAEQVARAREAEKELRRVRRELSDRLVEPPRGVNGECTKIRLHTREEALAFGEKVAAELGEPSGAYHPYQCKQCPRHPATMCRFWHTGHAHGASKAARQQRAIEKGREFHQGNTLRQRATPEDIARLRRV